MRSNPDAGALPPPIATDPPAPGVSAGAASIDPTPRPALDVAGMRRAAAAATALLRALANEDRLLLLCELSQGERSVGELESLLDIRQPTLSQQLAVLRAEGLVATRRDGKRIHYRVADDKALALLRALYDLYCGDAA